MRCRLVRVGVRVMVRVSGQWSVVRIRIRVRVRIRVRAACVRRDALRHLVRPLLVELGFRPAVARQ